MERLVTTSQAAQILGLSLQGVHYRIKKNLLKSIKKSGKTFVYITDEMEKAAATISSNTKVEAVNSTSQTTQTVAPAVVPQTEHAQAILDVKNEQIVLLKDSMKWMKKQYKSEILRLEKNQKSIVKVFNSEIKLLQGAFNEMRTIYKNEPKLPVSNNTQTVQETIISNTEFIALKDFFVLMKRHNKTEQEIKTLIFKAIQNQDDRFIYNKKEKKLLIIKSDFNDLV